LILNHFFPIINEFAKFIHIESSQATRDILWFSVVQ
jgi:hypothetical protein